MINNTINAEVTMGGPDGALLAGRYRVVRQLGQGGMGSVWLAEDMKLDGFKVAIKMLPSVLVNNKRAYAQVKAEALVSLKLSHPNIATVRAFEEESGSPFLVMDYIDGQTLDDYLAEKGKLSEDEAIRLLKPVAAALDYAHAQGVVHRDVKPGNVMIRRDGTPFVLDFGIAREIQETMTRVTGKLSSGTLLYMSPEQLNGDAPKPAQDVYSFAAMTYECLRGEPPFSRGGIEDQIKHKTPESLGPQFVKCGLGVMAGLAKSSEDRPGCCTAVLEKGGTSVVQTDASVFSSKRRIAIIGALLPLVALIGLGGWLWRGKVKSDELAAERARQIEIATRESARQKAETERISAEKIETERKAEEAHKAEEARIAAESAAHKAKVDDERIAEEKRRIEEARILAEKAEAERKAKADIGLKVEASLNAFRNEEWEKGWKLSEGVRDEDPRLQFYVGWCYAVGLAVAQDASEAVRWYRKAADLGNAKAQWFLGVMYETGSGVAKDEVEAVRWYRKAADQGNADGQNHLGEMYEDGRGVVKDAIEAVRWYREAADQGNADAQNNLGGMYENGRGVESNEVEAVRWYRMSAEQGNQFAQNNLGRMYETGRGVAKDEVEAIRWYRKAADQGNEDAQNNLRPRIRFVVKLGDREVRATAMFDGESFVSPWVWDEGVVVGSCVPNVDIPVEYVEGGKKYVGAMKSRVVDWQGLRTFVVTLEESKEPKSGSVMVITLPGGVKMEMSWCPPGNFIMGSPNDEAGRYDNEVEHQVTLTQGFWIGKYEVTQAQWESVMGSNPAETKGDDLPVVKVSWADCQDFCRKAGNGLRLPTEAEWEYACRAGKSGTIAVKLADVAWYGDNRLKREPHTVGRKVANAWGVHDMYGNVWEWCADWFGDYPRSAVSDPKGPETGEGRVFRGGSWKNSARDCRPACRRSYNPSFRYSILGFRVVCVSNENSITTMSVARTEDSCSTSVADRVSWLEKGSLGVAIGDFTRTQAYYKGLFSEMKVDWEQPSDLKSVGHSRTDVVVDTVSCETNDLVVLCYNSCKNIKFPGFPVVVSFGGYEIEANKAFVVMTAPNSGRMEQMMAKDGVKFSSPQEKVVITADEVDFIVKDHTLVFRAKGQKGVVRERRAGKDCGTYAKLTFDLRTNKILASEGGSKRSGDQGDAASLFQQAADMFGSANSYEQQMALVKTAYDDGKPRPEKYYADLDAEMQKALLLSYEDGRAAIELYKKMYHYDNKIVSRTAAEGIAVIYEVGSRNVQKDEQAAMQWWGKAAELGSVRAKKELQKRRENRAARN